MFIKLSGADFSADNIGLIQPIHSLTAKVFQHQTRFTVDSPQGVALNNFFWEIDKLNLNIGTFVSPWLANDLSESCYDSVNDAVSTPPSGYTITDGLLVPPSNYSTIGMPTRVSAKNWFLVFRGSKKNLNGIITNQLRAYVYTMPGQAYIAKNISTDPAGAYYADNAQFYTLYEINSYDNLGNDGNLYINGVKPTAGSSVNTSIDEGAMSGFMPSFSASHASRMIYISGDGNTILTAEQRAVLMSAASDLANVLVGNESS